MQKSTSLDEWFETPLGQYLLEQEQAYFDRAVADLFGFNALQLGLCQYDLLRANRMPFRCSAGGGGPVKLMTDLQHLPIASQSIDLLVLPHVLEFSANPHQILREVERVLMPEGRIIVSGFNPWSLWGARRLLESGDAGYPWCGKFINLPRLKDWLALLGFEMAAGSLCCYAPPFRGEKWLSRFHFMEPAGDRWWAMAGGVYFLHAIKRVHGMRLITPRWNEAVAANRALAPAQKVVNFRKTKDETSG
jgi:SAM-dependent methyltransferase